MNFAQLITRIDEDISQMEIQLYHHPYQAMEDDYEIIDGEKVYSQEFLSNMPPEYATMLARFGTLMEIKSYIEHEEPLSSSKSNPRFQISFNE